MTLGTHAVTGAAVASVIPFGPAVAFFAAFLSHFILDSIPHWDYRLRSIESHPKDKLDTDMKIGKPFLFDLSKIALDLCLGAIVIFIFFRGSPVFPNILLIGATGAVLPDVLQFVYFKIKREPLRSLQIFHMRIHSSKKIKDHVTGVFFQVILVAVVVSISMMLQ